MAVGTKQPNKHRFCTTGHGFDIISFYYFTQNDLGIPMPRMFNETCSNISLNLLLSGSMYAPGRLTK